MRVTSKTRLVCLRYLIPHLLLCGAALAWQTASASAWSMRLTEAERLERSGDLVGAQAEFDAALREARLLGVESTALAHVLDGMGAFYSNTGRFTEAESRLEESLRIWRHNLGPDHAALIRVVNRLASVYIESGDLGKAERLDLPLWLDRLRAGTPARGELLPLLQNMGTLDSLRGRIESAHNRFEEALELTRGAQPDSDAYASTVNDVGVACLRAKQYGAAAEYLTAALAEWNRLSGPGAFNAGLTAFNLGLALEGLGRLPEAAEQMQAALAISEKCAGPDSLRTAGILAEYAQVLRRINRKSEAKLFAARSNRIFQQQGRQAPSTYSIDVTQLSLRPR